MTDSKRMTDDIDALRSEARRKALEEAAKLVEDHLVYTGPGGFDPHEIQLRLAARIRELIWKEAKA